MLTVSAQLRIIKLTLISFNNSLLQSTTHNFVRISSISSWIQRMLCFNYINDCDQSMSQRVQEIIIWCSRNSRMQSWWLKVCSLKSPPSKCMIELSANYLINSINYRNVDDGTLNGNGLNQDRLNNNHSASTNGEYIQMIDKCSDLLNKVQIQKHVNNNGN